MNVEGSPGGPRTAPVTDAVLALVGGETLPILLPLADHPDARVVLLTSAQSRDRGENLRRAIEAMGRVCTSMEVSPYDLHSVRTGVEAAGADYSNPVVNLTGGTKMMSLAAFMVAQEKGWNWEYVVSETNEIITAAGKRPLEAKHFEPLTLNVYLSAGGLRLHKSHPGTSPYAKVDKDLVALANTLAGNRKLRNWLNSLGQSPATPPRDLAQEIGKNRDALMRMLREGTWLELHTAWLASEIGGEGVLLNVHFEPVRGEDAGAAAPDNEFDVVFKYRGRLVMLECKASKTGWGKELVEQRLHLTRRFGGKYAIGGFVLGEATGPGAVRVQRARNAGMFVGSVSPRLREDLKSFLDDVGPAL